MKIKHRLFFIMGGLLLAVSSCKKSTPVQAAQNNATISLANNTPVNVSVLVSSYGSLTIVGGTAYIPNAGLDGILLYRESQTQFIAFERCCTYDGVGANNSVNARAKVWMQTGNLSCKDSVCGSVFNIADGTIMHGPASYSLKQYSTSFDGNNIVHITN